MRSMLVLAALTLAVPLAVHAKKGGGGKPAVHKGQAPSSRAMSELAGKFKWGATHAEILKVISEDLDLKYAELIKKELDVYKQDLLRKQKAEDLDKVKQSIIKFDGAKSGWDTSIIDKEYGHKNQESMLVMWEKDQRRFLFFWNDKLYKQFIAFNAEHPAFAGKTFDDFAKLIQNRYGQAEMKMTTLRTKDDVTLDHLEWPPSGDYTLWAIDQSHFYGNFCLKLMQTSVYPQVEKSRAERSPKQVTRTSIIDSVTAPEQVKGDPNADIVDSIIGRKAQRTNQGGPVEPSEPAADGKTKPAKKKGGKAGDPLEGMNL